MNIIILSHERSLNKCEGLLNAYQNENVILVLEQETDLSKKPYVKKANRTIISKGFDILSITNKIKSCDKIWSVSENLLPIQSQLEAYYGIKNLNPYAAEVLSNKQMFDNFCRNVGLGSYVPKSVTPLSHEQLDIFEHEEFFTKPDIGTGSNVFYPGSYQNIPDIEYRRWNNKNHFLTHLENKNLDSNFFDLNQSGMCNQRFNYKPCRIMAQEYHWSDEPSICPVGFVKDGIIKILFYLKISKVKFGDKISYKKNPIELHSLSEKSDIAKDLAVWVVSIGEIDSETHNSITFFLQTIISCLQVKELFFSGPDFHKSKNGLIAIDFNPRPGQFLNILDKVNDDKLMPDIVKGNNIKIRKQLLWGCAILKPGKISYVNGLEYLAQYLNSNNTKIEEGVEIPEFQNLQNKNFNVNLNIVGKNEQELFYNYKTVIQLLQNCISY